MAYAVFEWLRGPPLLLAHLFPSYDRAQAACDRPWHCLEVTRVVVLSLVLHTCGGGLGWGNCAGRRKGGRLGPRLGARQVVPQWSTQQQRLRLRLRLAEARARWSRATFDVDQSLRAGGEDADALPMGRLEFRGEFCRTCGEGDLAA